jgi:hypothetical protein
MSKSPTASAFNSAARGTASQQHVPMQRGGDQQSPVSHDNPNDPRNPNYQAYQQQQYGGGGGGGDGGGGYPQPAGDGYGLEQQSRFWDADAGLDPSFDERIADDHDVIDSEMLDDEQLSGMGHAPMALHRMVQQREWSVDATTRSMASAVAHGRFGFMLDPSKFGTGVQTVLSAEVASHDACEWTLNLIAAKYVTGVLTANGLPPDNQLIDFQSSNGATLQGGNLVRIEYGADGAYETVDIDYPMRGASLNFVGASVRVSLVGGTSWIPCMVGGFLTPKGKSPGTQNDVPTRTVLISANQASAGPTPNPTNVAIPGRAKSYRIMFAQATGVPESNGMGLRQMNGLLGGILSVDQQDNQPPGNTPFSQSDAYVNGYRLHPSAEVIQVRNNSLTFAYNLYLQFDLDLG